MHWSVASDFLASYYPELDQTSPAQLLELIQAEDKFSASIPVFTYRGADNIEKHCEVPGWPNVTHDGELMHENMFSTDRSQVVELAKTDAKTKVEMHKQVLDRLEADVARLRDKLEQAKADLATLEEDSATQAGTA